MKLTTPSNVLRQT